VTFPIEIRAGAIAVFFKTAREADRLIEGSQAQGVPTSSARPAPRSCINDVPVDYCHSTDIAAQLREDALLRASVQIPQPFRHVLRPRSVSTGRGLGPGRRPAPAGDRGKE
jgi:hypothetical protein